jgi:citronellol/citronellal dehydrogenase
MELASNLKGKTAFITGASRGIGRAMALRLAKEGCNVVIAAKTSDPHPKLAGTIHSVAAEVEALGVGALPVMCDVRSEESVQAAIDACVAKFGGLDILINNAGAISLTPLAHTSVKKFDLMLTINARAVFLCAHLCLPHLKKNGGHILSLSPPVRVKNEQVDPKWMDGHAPYTLTKYGMTLLTLGFAQELRDDGIAVNALWPRTMISTAATDMLLGDEAARHSRTPAIMADAAWEIVRTQKLGLTGQALLDEDILRTRGVTNFKPYLCEEAVDLWADLYVDGYGEGALPL